MKEKGFKIEQEGERKRKGDEKMKFTCVAYLYQLQKECKGYELQICTNKKLVTKLRN